MLSQTDQSINWRVNGGARAGTWSWTCSCCDCRSIPTSSSDCSFAGRSAAAAWTRRSRRSAPATDWRRRRSPPVNADQHSLVDCLWTKTEPRSIINCAIYEIGNSRHNITNYGRLLLESQARFILAMKKCHIMIETHPSY